MPDTEQTRLLELTACIVEAQLSATEADIAEVPSIIRSVYAALASAMNEPEVKASESRLPAVPVKKSVFPEYIVCLEDGRKMKMLKRHLKTVYGITPQQYRERWGLPPDYPVVAPAYAQARSVLARELGLGRKRASGPVVQHIAVGRRGKRLPRNRTAE